MTRTTRIVAVVLVAAGALALVAALPPADDSLVLWAPAAGFTGIAVGLAASGWGLVRRRVPVAVAGALVAVAGYVAIATGGSGSAALAVLGIPVIGVGTATLVAFGRGPRPPGSG